MKKLLSLLSTIVITCSGSIGVISCSAKTLSDNSNNSNTPNASTDNIQTIIKITDLGEISSNDENNLLNIINSKNNLSLTLNDISITNIANTSAVVTGITSDIKGSIYVSFTLSNTPDTPDTPTENLSDVLTSTSLSNIDDSSDQTVKEKILSLNSSCPSDIYFVDNSMDSPYSNGGTSGSAIVKSHSYKGQVTVTYNNTITDQSSKANTSLTVSSWEDANLSRKNKITSKTTYTSNSTYYSPFLDTGMWVGNEVDSFISSGATLTHATIAFVTQDKDDDGVNIGGNKIGDGADSSYLSMIKTHIVDPIYKANNNSLKNLKISFGGASSQYEIWKSAEAKYSDKESIVNDIKNKIISTSKIFSNMVGASDYSKDIDFDIESGTDLSDPTGIGYLFDAMASLEKEDSSWTFSITPAALPSEGMLSTTSFMLTDIAKSFSEAGVSKDNLVTINPMCMDYGASESGYKVTSEFELARKTVNSIKEQYKTELTKVGYQITDDELYHFMAATPMIGVNDTVSEVFTVEDAKELYNWSRDVGLKFIGNWSGNDDHPGEKSVQQNGLSYASDYDFAKSFNGNW